MLSPILDEISNERGLLVGKLNIDENPQKMEEFSVHSIPTMVLFKSGQPVKTITGAKPKHLLLKELSEWI
jgi:thioredoxin 1